jgi:hypothetical protein
VAVVQYTVTHKQYIEQHNKFGKTADRAPSLRVICLITEEKAGKNLSQDSRKVPAGTMKTEYTEQNTHNNKHKNKNT